VDDPWTLKKILKGLKDLSAIYETESPWKDETDLKKLFYDPETKVSPFLAIHYARKKVRTVSSRTSVVSLKELFASYSDLSEEMLSSVLTAYKNKIKVYIEMFISNINRKITNLEIKQIQDAVVDIVVKFESLDRQEVGGNHFSLDLGTNTTSRRCGDPTKFITTYLKWLKEVKFPKFPIQPSNFGTMTPIWGEFCDYIYKTLGYNLKSIDGRVRSTRSRLI